MWPGGGNLVISKCVSVTSQTSPYTSNTLCSYAVWTSKYGPHSRRGLISARSLSQPITLTTWRSLLHELHQAIVHTLLNTPHDSSAKMKQLRGLYEQTFFTF